MGTHIPDEAPTARRPMVGIAPSREKTALGIGLAPNAPPPAQQRAPRSAPPSAVEAAALEPAAPREKSVTIDVVVMEPERHQPLRTKKRPEPPKPASSAERSVTVPGVRRRRARRWVGLLVLLASLALVAGGAYRYRSRIPQQQIRSFVASTIVRGHALLSRLRVR